MSADYTEYQQTKISFFIKLKLSALGLVHYGHSLKILTIAQVAHTMLYLRFLSQHGIVLSRSNLLKYLIGLHKHNPNNLGCPREIIIRKAKWLAINVIDLIPKGY